MEIELKFLITMIALFGEAQFVVDYRTYFFNQNNFVRKVLISLLRASCGRHETFL